jgi:integrase
MTPPYGVYRLSRRACTGSGSAQSARVVKSRVKELVKQRGRSEAEADELVELISGHSLRAGYATSAAARNMPAYRIQSHTRHKSAQIVAGYIREADKWTKSGLDGVGF